VTREAWRSRGQTGAKARVQSTPTASRVHRPPRVESTVTPRAVKPASLAFTSSVHFLSRLARDGDFVLTNRGTAHVLPAPRRSLCPPFAARGCGRRACAFRRACGRVRGGSDGRTTRRGCARARSPRRSSRHGPPAIQMPSSARAVLATMSATLPKRVANAIPANQTTRAMMSVVTTSPVPAVSPRDQPRCRAMRVIGT
jgi:hypothetical protein